MQLIYGCRFTQAVYVLTKLGIAEILKDGSKSLGEIGEKLEADVNSDALNRVMRALCSLGVLYFNEDETFCLTEMGQLLTRDAHGSLAGYAILSGEENYRAWGSFLYSVESGQPSFEKEFDQKFFDYLEDKEEFRRNFHSAMGGIAASGIKAVVNEFDFSRFKEIVDVGGGAGHFLLPILEKHPDLNGILYDRPEVAEQVKNDEKVKVLGQRCRVQAGNFFESVPSGGDAYILKFILHDWPDEDAIRILKACRQSMGEKSRLLVVETLLLPPNELDYGKFLDLQMLVLFGGKERTQSEYARLFDSTGFKLHQVHSSTSNLSVIEALPV